MSGAVAPPVPVAAGAAPHSGTLRVEGHGEPITFPADHSEITLGDWCDLRRLLGDAARAIESDDPSADGTLEIAAAVALACGGPVGALPYAAPPGHASLETLVGLLADVVGADVAPPPSDLPIAVAGADGIARVFDPHAFADYGGTLLEFVQASELERHAPADAHASDALASRFFGVTLRQCAVLFRSEADPLPLGLSAREAFLTRVSLALRGMPAHHALNARAALVNFVSAWRRSAAPPRSRSTARAVSDPRPSPPRPRTPTPAPPTTTTAATAAPSARPPGCTRCSRGACARGCTPTTPPPRAPAPSTRSSGSALPSRSTEAAPAEAAPA